MNRWYFKCTYCERPFAVNCQSEEVETIRQSNCPLCNEKTIRVMGRVEQTNIVRERVKAACDLRCTSAVGPHCDCVCTNENHGTHRLVFFNKVVGKLEVVNKDMWNDNENYLARIKRMAAAKNRIKVNVITFLNWKNKVILDLAKEKDGYWRLAWDDYHKYSLYQQMLRKIDKIEDLKSIQRKINSLTKLIPRIGSNLEYLEAIFDKNEVKV